MIKVYISGWYRNQWKFGYNCVNDSELVKFIPSSTQNSV